MKFKTFVFTAVFTAASIITCASCTASPVAATGSNRVEKMGYQLEMPAPGEEIAVLTTDMGTVKLRLFPGEAPKAVENFKGLIRKGYYNGLTFHRVVKDFVVQTGDPTGTGSGGKSIWNKPFADEFNANLLNIRGAVAMANSGKNTNESQLFIDQAGPEAFSGWSQFNQAYYYFKQSKMTADDFTSQFGSNWLNMDKVTQEYRELYEKYGGNPHLDGYYNLAGKGHTVFGQVFDGMSAVDKIACVHVDSNDKPVSDVKIIGARIEKYEK